MEGLLRTLTANRPLAKDTSLIQNAHPFGFTVCRVNTLVVSRLFRLPCEHALYVEK